MAKSLGFKQTPNKKACHCHYDLHGCVNPPPTKSRDPCSDSSCSHRHCEDFINNEPVISSDRVISRQHTGPVSYWCHVHFRMQDGSRNKSLPTSKLLREPSAGRALEGNGGMFSEASSDGELCMDSGTELDCGDGDFADLNAFLSADEINRSLDLAREAFTNVCEPEDPGWARLTEQEQALQSASSLPISPQTPENFSLSSNLQHQTKAICPEDHPTVPLPSNQSTSFSKPELLAGQAPSSEEKPVCHKPAKPVYKQDKPRLVHGGLELSDRAASASEFCSRAATFIEELSSIFKGSAHVEQQVEEESSSPDSGYLSPRNQRGSASVPSLPPGQRDQAQSSQSEVSPHSAGPAVDAASDGDQHSAASATFGPLSPPQFLQKLKSQEIAEGSPIRLECRVGGNPPPLVRYVHLLNALPCY